MIIRFFRLVFTDCLDYYFVNEPIRLYLSHGAAFMDSELYSGFLMLTIGFLFLFTVFFIFSFWSRAVD